VVKRSNGAAVTLQSRFAGGRRCIIHKTCQHTADLGTSNYLCVAFRTFVTTVLEWQSSAHDEGDGSLPSAENLGGALACLFTSPVTSSLAACMASTPGTLPSTMSLGLVACSTACHTPAMSHAAVRLAAQQSIEVRIHLFQLCIARSCCNESRRASKTFKPELGAEITVK